MDNKENSFLVKKTKTEPPKVNPALERYLSKTAAKPGKHGSDDDAAKTGKQRG
jgi:hypothetical protein